MDWRTQCVRIHRPHMNLASITTGKFALNASMPALYVATSTPEDAVTGPMLGCTYRLRVEVNSSGN